MRKIFAIIFIFTSIFSTSLTLAQNNVTYSKIPTWKFGYNLGAVYQNSDVRTIPGFGNGFTLEKVLIPSNETFFGLSIRGQYLKGKCYGLDWEKSLGLNNNLALNGYSNSFLDYNSTLGYVYANHKTEIKDYSLELMLYANKLRANTKVLLYIWGGVDVTNFSTHINQYDSNNMALYDYSKITQNNKRDILNQLDLMLDDNYESLADGLKNFNNVFAPSLGFGIGYQLSPSVALTLEHKITYPYTDRLDGQRWNDNNILTGDNDIYHYTSLGITLVFGKKGTPQQEKPKRQITNVEPVEKNDPPNIIIYKPTANPYTSSNCQASIVASVLNITSKDQITVIENEQVINKAYYDYNVSNNTLSINRKIEGPTDYKIIAYNKAGKDEENLRILCSNSGPSDPKPNIEIISPTSDPFYSQNCYANITAFVNNISGKDDLLITVNGSKISPSSYVYTSSNHKLAINYKLKDDANILIIAKNNSGSASKQITIKCKESGVKPEIYLIKPNTNSISTENCIADIQVRITNVQNESGIKVYQNGSQMSEYAYHFIPSTGYLTINRSLEASANFEIKASNNFGSASQVISINCVKVFKPMPTVSFTQPSSSPYQVQLPNYSIEANTSNVSSKSEIAVFVNNRKLQSSEYSFLPSTGKITFVQNVATTTTIKIMVSNENGSSDDEVKLLPVSTKKLPEITIITPKTNPYTAPNCEVYISATVLNIASKNNIKVYENNNLMSASKYSYNVSTNLLTIDTKVNGNTKFLITAENNDGDASASQNIECKISADLPKPVINVTTPTINPYNTYNCSAYIVANISNIMSVNDITVKENGSAISSTFYKYNSQTKNIVIEKPITDKSVFIITAQNKTGSSSETITINCIKLDPLPIITITNPESSPYSSSECKANISAKIQNITSVNQLKVKENGATLSSAFYSFNASSNILTITKSVSDVSTFEIIATNNSGEAKETMVIKCVKTQPLPEITIITPTISPFTSPDCKASIKAKIKNVGIKGSINITENGTKLNYGEYTFNPSSNDLIINRNIDKQTTYVITASNASGSDSKTTIINCVKTVAKPIIIVTKPSKTPFTSVDCKAEIIANIQNIENKNQIKVYENNVLVSGEIYSFNSSTSQFSMTKEMDSKSQFKIVATNEGGTAESLVLINCLSKPSVEITKPSTPTFETGDCNVAIEAKVKNVRNKTGIKVNVNGKDLAPNLYSYEAVKNIVSFSVDVVGSAKVIITATNAAGSASDDVTINCVEQIAKPVVTITKPTTENYTAPDQNFEMEAKILNVKSKAQIKLFVDGKISGPNTYTFDAKTNILKYSTTLTKSMTIKILASNVSGSATDKVDITFESNSKKPEIIVIRPTNSPFTTAQCIADVLVEIKNVGDITKVVITENGETVDPTYITYDKDKNQIRIYKDVSTISEFIFKATNGYGTASKEVKILCTRQ